MISIPQFDIRRESAGALWLGLGFFSRLTLLRVASGPLPYALPKPRVPQSDPPFLRDPAARAALRSAPQRNVHRAVGGIAGALVLTVTTVAPIARELRARRRRRAAAAGAFAP